MTELLQAGGWVMIPIGICLFLTIAIAIERMVNLRLSRFLNMDDLEKLRRHLAHRSYDAALGVCRARNLMFNRLMETAVVYRDLDAVELRALLEDQSRQEANALERFLTLLKTVATISPLLGLLGTVAGMIKVFQTLSVEGMSQAPDLAGGISEALITTATGLTVAIPAIVLFNFFERRIEKIMLVMEKRMIELILLLRGAHALPQE